MVAIFTGAGTGFERGSGTALGASGLLGSATVGRSGEQLFLNAANGNLLVSQQDEFLVGRGPDASIGRTYNSLGNQSDDNGDNWRQSTQRAISLATGTLNAWGSALAYRGGDGSEIIYGWNGSAYVATDGAGPHDRITWNGTLFSRTDGDTRTVETYESDGATAWYRLKTLADTSGNSLTYDYSGGKLANVRTANGERISYVWSGNHIQEIVRAFNEGGTWKDQVTTRYGYDTHDRLTSVSVDLIPDDNATADGNCYVTRYTYYGASDLIATISETDGSGVGIAYDAYGRVSQLSQTMGDGAAARVTSIEYGSGHTIVTDPLGVKTRLEYVADDFAASLDSWGSGNVTRQPATIDGHAAIRYTTQVAGGWSGIVQGINAAAGETVTWGLTLQAVGGYSTQDLGLHGDVEGWGSADIASARIVSGPGHLEQLSGGLWRVVGLSDTTGTRIEITRTYKQAQAGGAYFYVDNPGGYRAGVSLLAADPVLTRSTTAVDPGYMNAANWYIEGASQAPAGVIDGSPAYQYTVTDSNWSGTATWRHVDAGDRVSYSISLQAASAGSTSQSLGLWGDNSGWGLPADTIGRIVSGPGTLTRTATGFWAVSGLSTSQATRIEIVRNYDRAELSGAYLYFDQPGGHRLGQTLIAGAPYVVRQTGENGRAGQLTRVTTAYGTAQAQTVQFGYSDTGDLTSVIDAMGRSSTFTYDANGNQLTATDRLGNVVTRTYDAANKVLTETRMGSDADSAAAYHTTRYAYDDANRLRFVVSAEGDVTEYTYNGYGEVWLTQAYRTRYDLSGLGATSAPSVSQMSSWTATAEATEISMVEFGYDNRGGLWSTIRYGGSVSPGNAHGDWGYRREDYTYDSAGRLRQSTVAGQRTQYFSYDGLNRLTGKTDLDGGRTSFAFQDAGGVTIVTLAGGATQTSTYNKAGELVGYVESGNAVQSGTASNTYDGDGRLRVRRDATGVEIYYFYDLLGRKVAEADAYGDFTEYGYDADNRLVATVHYDTAVGADTAKSLATLGPGTDLATIRPVPGGSDLRTWTVYDREERVLEAIEGDGAVTAYEYDAAGRLVKTIGYADKLSAGLVSAFWSSPPAALIVPATNAKDRVARVFYDKAGRVTGALDGEGHLTRTVYDGAGQKVREIAYANATNAADRASGSFQALIDSVGTSANDRSVRYVHDQQGNLRFTIDALNHVTEYVYQTNALSDAYGVVRRTIRYADPLPAVSSYSYASLRNVVATMASNPANRSSSAFYDDSGRLAYAVDAAGAVTGYAYDTMGQVTRRIEYAALPAAPIATRAAMDDWTLAHPGADDRITRYYHAANGDLRFTIDAEGYITRTDYDAAGRVTTIMRWDTPVAADDGWAIDAVSNAQSGNWASTSNHYDAAGRLLATYDGTGNSRRYYYHADGLLAWDVASEGGQDDSRTYYLYDAAGRKTSEEAGFGASEHATTTYSYNGLGDLIAVGGPNGNSTSFEYDRAGRVIRQANGQGSPTAFDYNAFGERVSVTNARGFTSYNYYDNAGRVVATRDAESYVTETGYNAFGDIAHVKQAYNRATNTPAATNWPAYVADTRDAVTQFTYDKLGRVLTTTDAEGGVETNWYNAFGDVRAFQNKLGGITNYWSDRLGRLRHEYVNASVYDANGNQTSAGYYSNIYEYDARGNLVHQVEAYGQAERRDTWFAYDKANRLTSKWGEAVSVGLSPTMVTPTEYYRYDTRGNLTESIDAAGARTLFYYDDLNRKIATVTPAGTSANPQGVLTTFAYDGVGNLLKSRTWETPLVLAGLTVGGPKPGDPGGNYRETINQYDAVDRLILSRVMDQSVGAWNGSSYAYSTGVTLETRFLYDAVGNLIRTTAADDTVTYGYYDKLNRRTAQVDASSYVTTWVYDAEGNVTEERRWANQAGSVSVESYGVSASASDRITRFGYDRMGRRVGESRLDVEAWGINAGNGQLHDASGISAIAYRYNALGQVTMKIEATGDVTSYTYDNAGRLIQETRPAVALSGGGSDTPTVCYYYNALGQLTMTRQGGAAPSGNDRIARNLYDGDGRLTATVDALGQTRSYVYDAAGRKVGEYYGRELGNGGSPGAGTTVIEGISYQYDLAGNLTRQAINSIGGGVWAEVSATQSAYNAFGEVTDRGTNVAAGSAASGWQEHFVYDNAGHLIRSNAGDGVWRIHAYDKAGRQTLSIESDGTTDLSGMAQATAMSLIGGATVAATATLFDGRGQAVRTVQMRRQVAAGGGTQDIVNARGYTSFGELAWEQDALGRTTDYGYNTMGRVVQIRRPTVSMTADDGTVSDIRPTEKMFYDIAGRLIGTRDANSVWTGSGARTTRQLVAGTGYGDGEALVAREWHPDGGVVTSGYDVFGNLVATTDEIGRTTAMAYDKLGQLVQVTRPATAAGTLVDYYSYDVLGNRLGHWNNVVGYAGREGTEYDALGRVTLQRAFGGDYTTTSYGWYGAMATSGMGSFGGWIATTSYVNGRSGTEYTDVYGRLIWKRDLGDNGGHITTAGYDLLGRMTWRQITGEEGTETSTYAWLGNGRLGTVSTTSNGIGYVQSSTYDLVGNKLTEYGTRAGVVVQNATATYDALGRLVTWSEAGDTPSVTPPASSAYQYDANSNVMRTSSTFRYLDQYGAAVSYDAVKTDAYRYDSMNRMVQGGDTTIAYDAAGQRIQVSTWSDGLVWTGWQATVPGSGMTVYADDPAEYGWQGYHWANIGRVVYTGRVVETYSYNANGQIDQVWISAEGADADAGPGVTPNGSFGPSVKRAYYDYDLLGRVTSQTDYEADGTTVAYNRSSIVYNAKGQVTSETQTARQGNNTLVSHIANLYDAGSPATYALGTVVSTTSDTWKNGSDSAVPDTVTANGFEWWDGAVLSAVAYRPDASDTSVQWNTSYALTAGGRTAGASIADGRPRTVGFTLDALGQVLRRDESDNNSALGDPHQLWYRFNGREMGKVTNDSVDTAYLASIASRQTASGPGAFRNGASVGGGHAVFGEAYQALTSFSQGSSGGSYEAQGGETLEAVALQLWGDGNLWYRLAEANGLSAPATLAAGQRIAIPAGVLRNTNSATTFKPYDPAEALGSLSPTNPRPSQKGNKCGAFGAIIMVAVAVAVTALTRAPFAKLFAGIGLGSAVGSGVAITGTSIGAASAAGIAGAVATGVAASAGSQLFGVAAGIQDRFDWKGVALAGIGAGVGGGLSGIGRIAGSAFLGDMVRGALGSAVTQGIGVATGLQNGFAFAGVAAAGMGAGVAGAIGLGGLAGEVARNAAGSLANAATRSLIDGTDFGDNILAALPDIIGQTVGGLVADRIAERRNGAREADDPLDGTGVSEITIGGLAAALSLRGEILIVSGGKIPESVAEAQALRAKALQQVASAKASRAEKDRATAKVRAAFAPYLDEARYASSTDAGSALAFVQSLADGLSSTLSKAIASFDADYQAGRNYIDKLGPVLSSNPLALLADATEGFSITVASALANTPSALAHPMRTFVWQPAAFIDGVLSEEAKGQGYQRAFAALQSSTPRQLATGVGRTAGAVVLVVGPTKFAASRTSVVSREYAPIAAETVPLRSGPRLLPTEGNVGTYRDLIKAGSPGDNITPNHIPSANRMAQDGVSKGDGIAINVEQPVPGVGGRHRATFTYGTRADANMTPRDALAAGVWDARGIYRADGLYGPQIRGNLQDLIRMNKTQHPTIFRKPRQ